MESQSIETDDGLRKPSEIGEEIRKELERRGFRAPKSANKPTNGDPGNGNTKPLQPLPDDKIPEIAAQDAQVLESPQELDETLIDIELADEQDNIESQAVDLPDTAPLQLEPDPIQHVEVSQDIASSRETKPEREEPIQVVVQEPESPGENGEELPETAELVVQGQEPPQERVEDLPQTAELNEEILEVLEAYQNVSQVKQFRDSSDLDSEIVESFLSRASHELRTPLQTITGFLELLLDGKMTDSKQVEQFTRLSYREGNYLAGRIADLEVASHIEAGTLRISPTPLSMVKVIKECIRSFKPFIWDHEFHFDESKVSDLPSVNADKALIQHALTNVIGIAIKSTPFGGDVKIQISRENKDLVIHVASEAAEEIAPNDGNADTIAMEATSGESIGIFIARKILQAHRGFLNLQGSEEQQVAYTIHIPLQVSQQEMGTILITEDNPQAAMLLEIALEKEGYTPIRATNGLEALEIVANDSVDLVLLDVILPGMDGFEVCYRMRSSPDTASIPVVIVSAKSGDEDQAKALRVGADAYFRKPLGLSELLVAMEGLLKHGHNNAADETIPGIEPNSL
jgi:CheY-like chemotaxis protein